MGRPPKNIFIEIKEEFENKGAKLVCPEEFLSTKTPINFLCSNCGDAHHISYDQYFRKGQNQKLLCKRCQFLLGPVGQRITTLVEKNGAKLVDIVQGKHSYFIYQCPDCGSETKVYLDNIESGKTTELKCAYCRSHSRKPKQEEIMNLFEERGSKLISNYKSAHEPLDFICTKCGGVGHITYSHFMSGVNRALLCSNCIPNAKTPFAFIKAIFEQKGAVLLSTEYKNDKEPLVFLCSNCKKEWYTTWDNFFHKKVNPDLLCPECYMGRVSSPESTSEINSRSNIDNYWLDYIPEFFNIPKSEIGKYASHHIKRYSTDPDFRTSIPNGYPLLLTEHKGNSRFYHFTPKGREIQNWSEVAKLPYHNYTDFKFLDFNTTFISEIIYPQEDMEPRYLLNRKKAFQEQGLFYMPIFWTEMILSSQRQLVYSMIRNRLNKNFPDIYKYTGQQFTRLYARKLLLKEIDYAQAAPFFEESHIQGMTTAKVYIGLLDGDRIVSCMSLTTPRSLSKDKTNNCEWEIARFATLPNTIVIGGASKIFNYFINTYNPRSVVSFCDLRFSSLNPEDTVYAKLGFDYAGFSEPNYRYRDPEFNQTYSRQVFQKQNLEKRLKIYDPSLSESKNMTLNGYVKQYDCGNFKFVWKSSK